MTDRALSLLGLCRRAGKITIGCDAVIESVTSGQAQLVIFAADASGNTRKTVLSSVSESGIRIIDLVYDKEKISASLGRLCAVASINDAGFAKKLVKLLGEDNGEECNLC